MLPCFRLPLNYPPFLQIRLLEISTLHVHLRHIRLSFSKFQQDFNENLDSKAHTCIFRAHYAHMPREIVVRWYIWPIFTKRLNWSDVRARGAKGAKGALMIEVAVSCVSTQGNCRPIQRNIFVHRQVYGKSIVGFHKDFKISVKWDFAISVKATVK